MKRFSTSILAILAFILTLGAAGTTERYVALALPSSPLADDPSTSQIQTTIGIEAKTPANRIEELGAVAKKGSDALFRALNDENRTGWISITGRASVYATLLISNDTAKGREIVMVTPQPIYFFERRNPDRARDYRFGVIRLTLDKRGNGTGTVTAAATIKSITPTSIEVDDYGTVPARLTGVHLQP